MDEQISFSPWTQWAKRLSFNSNQGIYLWARFIQDLPSETSPADPLQKDVIYIGESCKGDGCFKTRWKRFDEGLSYPERIEADPKRYPRAKRYIEQFGSDRTPLYVATLTSKALMLAFIGLKSFDLLDIYATLPADLESFNTEYADLLVRYMERRLILLYAQKNSCRPVLNKE